MIFFCRCSRLLLILAVVALCSPTLKAKDGPTRIQTPNFLVHTDLPSKEACIVLKRMQRVLLDCERYWKKKLIGRIECYLVDDVENWEGFAFPQPSAMIVLRTLGGGTDTVVSRRPQSNQHTAAVIYATTELGIVEHEVVHAYCVQSFGRLGPDWYREGMAELFAQRVVTNDDDICHDTTIELLRSTTLENSLESVLAKQPEIRELRKAFDLFAQQEEQNDEPQIDADRIAQLRADYARNWALCYLLYHNSSYQQRFQAYGRGILSGHQMSFTDAFGAATPRIDFELKLMLRHICQEYDADVQRWRWPTRRTKLYLGDAELVTLPHKVNYFPTSVQVEAGEIYEVESLALNQQHDEDRPAHLEDDISLIVIDGYETHPVRKNDAQHVVKQSGLLYIACAAGNGSLMTRPCRVRICRAQ